MKNTDGNGMVSVPLWKNLIWTLMYKEIKGRIFFLKISFYLFMYLFRLCRILVEACKIFVAARKLLVAAWMRDLVPRAGIEPGPPALRPLSLIHWTTRKSQDRIYRTVLMRTLWDSLLTRTTQERLWKTEEHLDLTQCPNDKVWH